MSEIFIRAVKGLYMFIMFALFLAGILFHLVLVLPLAWVLGVFAGPKRRVEKSVRVGFTWWLWLLGISGLLRAEPTRGTVCEGPCIIVCNHPGLFDVLFLIKEIPDLTVMVKASLPRVLPLGPLLKALGYVLVPDYRKINPIDTAEEAIIRIREGSRLQLFPEGTRSPFGDLLRFKTGAFKIARMTKVPVQPVLIKNEPPFLPKGDRWYFPRREISRIRLEFWAPMAPPEKGDELNYARELEKRFRKALGMDPENP